MKRLIVCCDGTWQDLTSTYPTNVVKLATAIMPSDTNGVKQLVYYDEGIGTANVVDKYYGGGLGKGIDKNIQDAYLFLCLNYEPDDEVYLFGFSRGAYTVRSLAGMLNCVGLLRRQHMRDIPAAYEAYRAYKNNPQAAEQLCKRGLGVIDITLLGCWDTVGALGIPDKISWLPIDEQINEKYKFHNTTLGVNIKNALHAVAIDEYRKEFTPTLMHNNPDAPQQKVLRTWFAGDHDCVGGGVAVKAPLSDIALLWMVEAIKSFGLGLQVDLSNTAQGIQTDYRIYFDNTPLAIYDEKPREVACKPDELHDSVVNRWLACPYYRPENLKKAHGAYLNAQQNREPAFRLPLMQNTQLGVGESVTVVVHADNSRNDTHVDVVNGGRYRFSVAPLHCWKDGDFDVCDANGWTLDSAYQDGVRANLSLAKRKAIELAQSHRLVPEADWFTLVGEIVGNDGVQLIQIGDGKSTAEQGIQAGRNGRLYLAPNDLRSKLDVLDKYDNNQGWVFVDIERLA